MDRERQDYATAAPFCWARIDQECWARVLCDGDWHGCRIHRRFGPIFVDHCSTCADMFVIGKLRDALEECFLLARLWERELVLTNYFCTIADVGVRDIKISLKAGHSITLRTDPAGAVFISDVLATRFPDKKNLIFRKTFGPLTFEK